MAAAVKLHKTGKMDSVSTVKKAETEQKKGI